MSSKITHFANLLDVAMSKAFLGSQSTARNVLKDRWLAQFRTEIDRKEFEIVSGNISDNFIPQFDESRASSRGNGASVYSKSYCVEKIPEVVHLIIERHRGEIIRYLGKEFLYESPTFWRNHHMPAELKTYDVYSNVWHQDSHDGDRLLKIFVFLMDIGPDDGPFTYLSRADTLKHWMKLVERWDFGKIAALPEFREQQIGVGPKGTYLIINTANCMHRASIPKKFRDILQITLYPHWRKSSDRKVYPIGVRA